jgi:hypothetical protein
MPDSNGMRESEGMTEVFTVNPDNAKKFMTTMPVGSPIHNEGVSRDEDQNLQLFTE